MLEQARWALQTHQTNDHSSKGLTFVITGCGSASLELCVWNAASPWSQSLSYILTVSSTYNNNKKRTTLTKTKEQIKNEWPGLAPEVKKICEEIGVSNINEKDVSKEEIEEAVYFHHYKEMKLEVCEYKKLESVKNDDFTKLPEYMNEKSLENARMAFRIKTEMVNKIKMNFKGSYKNNLTCDKCMAEQNETQCHAMLCPGWAEQREGLDLSQMSDMVKFFTRLLQEKGGKNTKEGLP